MAGNQSYLPPALQRQLLELQSQISPARWSVLQAQIMPRLERIATVLSQGGVQWPQQAEAIRRYEEDIRPSLPPALTLYQPFRAPRQEIAPEVSAELSPWQRFLVSGAGARLPERITSVAAGFGRGLFSLPQIWATKVAPRLPTYLGGLKGQVSPAEAKTGLAQVEQQAAVEHPVATALGTIGGTITSYLATQGALGPAPAALAVRGVERIAPVYPFIAAAYPTLARAVANGAASMAAWGIRGGLAETGRQIVEGQFKPGKIVKEAALEAPFGAVTGATGAIARTVPRAVATGLGFGAYNVLEQAARTGKVSLPEAYTQAAIGLILGGIKGPTISKMYQQQAANTLGQAELLARIRSRNPALRPVRVAQIADTINKVDAVYRLNRNVETARSLRNKLVGNYLYKEDVDYLVSPRWKLLFKGEPVYMPQTQRLATLLTDEEKTLLRYITRGVSAQPISPAISAELREKPPVVVEAPAEIAARPAVEAALPAPMPTAAAPTGPMVMPPSMPTPPVPFATVAGIPEVRPIAPKVVPALEVSSAPAVPEPTAPKVSAAVKGQWQVTQEQSVSVSAALKGRRRYNRGVSSEVTEAATRLVAKDGHTRYVFPTGLGLAISDKAIDVPLQAGGYYELSKHGKKIRARQFTKPDFVTEVPAAAKEPWQMTWKEYRQISPKAFRLTHKTIVENALASGEVDGVRYSPKPVPPEVLAEYPDLATKASAALVPAKPTLPKAKLPKVAKLPVEREPTTAELAEIEAAGPVELARGPQITEVPLEAAEPPTRAQVGAEMPRPPEMAPGQEVRPSEISPTEVISPSEARDLLAQRMGRPPTSTQIIQLQRVQQAAKAAGLPVPSNVPGTKDYERWAQQNLHVASLEQGQKYWQALGHSTNSSAKIETFASTALAPRIVQRMTGEQARNLGSIVSQNGIIQALSRDLGVPIRRGLFATRGAAGIYKVGPRIIRHKRGEVLTVGHEIGHHLQNIIPQFGELDIAETISAEEIRALLALSPIKVDPGKEVKEAFAQFMNYYITDPRVAYQAAPTLAYYFHTTLAQIKPEVLTTLNKAQANYDIWRRLPAEERIASLVQTEQPRPEQGLGHRYTHLTELLWDDKVYLREYVQEVARRGVVTEQDAGSLAQLLSGITPKVLGFLEPLRQKVLLPTRKNYREFAHIYLPAKRIAEWKLQHQTGIDPNEARQVVARMEAKYPHFKVAQAELQKLRDAVLDYLVDAGVLSWDMKGIFKEIDPAYVPFYRVMDEITTGGMVSQRLHEPRSVIQRMRGSERPLSDPVENFIKFVFRAFAQADRNRILLSMDELAKKSSWAGRIFERVPRKVVPVAQVSPAEMKLLRSAGIELPDELAAKVMTVFRPMMSKPSGNIVSGFINGKHVDWYIADYDLYRTLTGLGHEVLPMALKVLGTPARLVRLGAVVYQPTFWLIRNPFRDMFSAFMNSAYGMTPVDIARGIFEAVGQGKHYKEFEAQGGMHSMFYSTDREYLQKDIKRLRQTALDQAKDAVRHPIEGIKLFEEKLRQVGEITELGPRLGEVIAGARLQTKLLAARNKIAANTRLSETAKRQALARIDTKLATTTPFRRTLAGREVTLDFAKTGSLTRLLNQFIPFFSPNMIDPYKIVHQFRKFPLKTTLRGLLAMTIPTILLWLHNRRDPRYQRLSRFRKDFFWNFPVPNSDKIVSLPIPFTYGLVFKVIPERLMEWLDTRDAKAFDGLYTNIMSSLSPGWMPTVLGIPAALMTGREVGGFRRVIIPERLERLPLEMQYTERTTETAKLLGKIMKYPPAKIDFFVEGLLAGLGAQLMRASDWAIRKVAGERLPAKPTAKLAEHPVLRAFLAPEPVGRADALVNEFYKKLDVAEKNRKRLDAIPGIAEKRAFLAKNPDIAYLKTMRKYATHLSTLRKAIRGTLASKQLDSVEKRRRIDLLNEAMSKNVAQALQLLETRKRIR